MTTIPTTLTGSPLLFLNATKTRNQNPHPLRTTLTFIPRQLPPLRLAPKKHKPPQAALLPIHTSFPLKPTLSSTISVLTSVSRTVAEKMIVSAHEFKEPLLALSNALGKWVELYHSVLMVRILLSWFPNMPWEKQPFSAIRDLCDPCLSFFRTIMPPLADKKIDVSPILAFVFFGVLSTFLKTNVQPPV